MMLRAATPEEKLYYETKMYPLQDKILSLIKSDRLYLTGGTCLSRFHLHHRYSQDLDFFYDACNFPKEDFDPTFKELYSQFEKIFTIEAHRDYDTFKRVLIHENDVTLKIEFVLEHLPYADKLKKIDGFYIDSMINVGANKITTVYGRKTYRDFFDLFFLLKEFPLPELIRLSETKIVPLDYEGVFMCLQAPFAKEEVIMKKIIDEKEFIDFIKDLQFKLLKHGKNIL